MSNLITRLTPHGRPAVLLAAVGLLALGGGAGAIAMRAAGPSVTMAPATPVAIRSLTDGIVTIRGRVAEEFGNKFVLQDATGRALVDAGREGEDADLVAPGRTVTVQGRFDRGVVHAAFLVRPDGEVAALAPLEPREHDRHGPRHGPDADRPGPDEDGAGPRAGNARPAPVTGAPSTPAPAAN